MDLRFSIWMGAGKPTEDYGVRNIKRNLEAILLILVDIEKIHNKFLYNLGLRVIRFGKRLPK